MNRKETTCDTNAWEEPPALSLTVTIEPPPIPMLWGLSTDVHRRAAMAPSTAEPPCWSMLLEKNQFNGILLGNLNTQTHLETITTPRPHMGTYFHTPHLKGWVFQDVEVLECCHRQVWAAYYLGRILLTGQKGVFFFLSLFLPVLP